MDFNVRNRNRKTFLSNFAPFFIFLICAVHISHGLQLDDILQPRIDAVEKLSASMASFFTKKNWCAAANNCKVEICFQHGCNGGGFGRDFECTKTKDSSIRKYPLKECKKEPKNAFRNESVCRTSEHPNDVLLNFERPVFYSDLQTIETKNDNSSMEVVNKYLRRDACQLQHLSKDISAAYNDNNLTSWIYAATINGGFTIFPGNPLCRGKGGPMDACGYNPTVRPWYIRTTSGPKDVVFLYDKTSLHGKTSQKALSLLIKSLSPYDYVSIIVHNESSAQPIIFDGLEKATESIKERLADSIMAEMVTSSGPGNLTLAIKKAFSILQSTENDGENSSNCNKYIVMLSGGSDVCFEKCKENILKPCLCVKDLSEIIEKEQKSLKSSASIISFTEGATDDLEKLSRTIVCGEKNKGVWKRINSDEDANTAMSIYTSFVGNKLYNKSPKIIISPIYEDEFGLGDVFTISLPTYVNTRLIGIAAADVRLSELMNLSSVSNPDDAKKKINELSESTRTTCPPDLLEEDILQLQSFRNEEENSAKCPKIVPENRKCYKFRNKIYRKYSSPLSFRDASKKCEDMKDLKDCNGSLAILKLESEAHAVSSIASVDGSWIGAIYNENEENLQWTDGIVFEGNEHQIFGFPSDLSEREDIKNLKLKNISAAGITLDRRGLNGNWNLQPLDQRRQFICQIELVPSKRSLEIEKILNTQTLCEGDIFDLLTEGLDCINTDCLLPKKCSTEENKEMESADPLCRQSGSSYTEFDRFCCGGRSEEDRCLLDNKCQVRIARWKIAVITVSAIIIAGIAIYLIVKAIRKHIQETNAFLVSDENKNSS